MEYPYNPKFVDPIVATVCYDRFMTYIPWVRRENVPRAEYWANDFNRPYTYGSEKHARTYESGMWFRSMLVIRTALWVATGVHFEGCFMNRYDTAKDALDWHADDDPGIDHSKPIAIVSFGSERRISLRSNDKLWHDQRILEHGSLLLMPAGSQHTHQHKITRSSDVEQARPRISLTFRSLMKENSDARSY